MSTVVAVAKNILPPACNITPYTDVNYMHAVSIDYIVYGHVGTVPPHFCDINRVTFEIVFIKHV